MKLRGAMIGTSLCAVAAALVLPSVAQAQVFRRPITPSPPPTPAPTPTRFRFIPGSAPDLIVENVRIERGKAVADIRNGGTVRTQATDVTLAVAGSAPVRQELPAIEPGMRRTVSFDLPAGAGRITITADSERRLVEVSETNNSGSVDASASAQPPVFRRPFLPPRPASNPALPPQAGSSSPSAEQGLAQAGPRPLRPRPTTPDVAAAATGQTGGQPIAAPNTQAAGAVTPQGEQALLARMGAPKLGPPPTFAPSLFVLVDGKPAPPTFHCGSPNRNADAVSLSAAGANHYRLTFKCGKSSFAAASTTELTVLMRKGETGPLANGAGPRKLVPGDPRLASNVSRLWNELSACLDAFSTYKVQDRVFDVQLIAGYPRCAAKFPGGPAGAAPTTVTLSGKTLALPKLPATIGDTAYLMLDRQRPERLARFFEATIDGELRQELSPMTGSYFYLDLDHLPPAPPSGGSLTKTVLGSLSQNFTFITREKPSYPTVIVQLIDRPQSYESRVAGASKYAAQSSSTPVIGATGTVKLGSAPLIGKGLSAGEVCGMQLAPQGLIGSSLRGFTSKQIADPRAIGFDMPGPVWVNQVAMSRDDIRKLAAGRYTGSAQLRVLPATANNNLPTCLGAPSDSARVNLGSPAKTTQQIFSEYDQSLVDQLKQQAAAIRQKAIAELPGGAQGSSPVIVEAIGWIPPDEIAPALIMTDVPNLWALDCVDTQSAKPIFGAASKCDPASQSPADMNAAMLAPADTITALPHLSSFSLDQAYPSAVWPWRSGWKTGQAYDPKWFDIARREKEKSEDLIDYLADGLNNASIVYAELKKGFVDTLTWAISHGQCNPPFSKEEEKYTVCKILDINGTIGLNLAMAWAGIPPTLPTTRDLIDRGAEYLAATTIDYVAGVDPRIGMVLDTAGRDVAAKWLGQEIRTAALGQMCADPTTPTTYQQQGYDGFDKITLCGWRRGDVTSHARWEGVPAAPKMATLFVRVRRNPSAIGYDSKFVLTTHSSQMGVPTMYQGAYGKLAGIGGYQPFQMGAPIVIDANDIPPEGLIVPVHYLYDEQRFRDIAKATPECNKSQLVSCETDMAYDLFIGLLRLGTQKLDVDIAYRFADVVRVSAPSTVSGEEKVVETPAIASYTAATLTGSLGKVYPGLTYAIPVLPTAPGFKYSGGTRPSGLPDYNLVPEKPLDDMY